LRLTSQLCKGMRAIIARMKKHEIILAALIAQFVFLSPASLAQETIPNIAVGRLPDGLYRVMRLSNDEKGVGVLSSGERLLINDFHFLEPAERQEKEFVVLQTEPFIPFMLAESPTKDKDSAGKPKLYLQLDEAQIKPLEGFTRQNTGQKVAIVIGGEIVTVHKVREAITGGKIQITRCTDNGCQAIYTEIAKKQGAK